MYVVCGKIKILFFTREIEGMCREIVCVETWDHACIQCRDSVCKETEEDQ